MRRLRSCAACSHFGAVLTRHPSPQLGTEGGIGLAVALMYERSQGGSSAWAPYLATLPAREPLPVTWAEPQLRLLQGTALPDSCAADRERLRADWQRHVKPLTAADATRFPEPHFSYDAYVAARTLTASRGFAVDAYHGEGLVPLADLFNHEPDEHVHFTGTGAACACCGRRDRVADGDDSDEGEEEDEEASGPEEGGESEEDGADEEASDDDDGSDSDGPEVASLDGGDDDPAELPPPRPASGPCPLCEADVAAPLPADEADDAFLTMEAVVAVPAGSEVFNTYGARSNAQLLHVYGFALRATPHDACRCDAPLVAQALREALAHETALATALPARLALAERAGLVESAEMDGGGSDGFELRAGEPLPRELLLLAALAAAPQSVAAHIAALCRKLRGPGAAVALPALPGGPGGDAVAEEPAEVMWHFLAAGPDAEDSRLPPGADPEDAAPLSDDETARLLREPAAAAALRRCVALRDALYPTASLSDDEVALAEAEAVAAKPHAAPEAAQEAAALRLRVSERRILAAATALLDQHAPLPQAPEPAEKKAKPAQPAKRKAVAEEEAPAAKKRTAADDPAWSLFD